MTLVEINQQTQDVHGEEEVDRHIRTHVGSVNLFP